jgi:predicted phage-related endonuclease
MSTATITTSTTVESSKTVSVLDGSNAEELMATFNQVKATIAELKKEQEKVDAQLRELLNGAEAGTINGVVRLKVEHRTKNFVDMEVLRKDFSEIYEKVQKSTPWNFLKTL